MKTHILVALLLLLPGFNVFSNQLSPSQALSRLNASNTKDTRKARIMSENMDSPIYTGISKSLDLNCFYVFQSNDSGYIILSADDVAMPLLGYVDNGKFDINNVAPEMKVWLEEYSREIEWAIKKQAQTDESSASNKLSIKSANTDFASIEPLCATKWNQGYPYYLQTPTINDTQTMTGCMATAMAQIAAYHKYPTCGTSSISYEDSYGTERSFNFEEHPIDWDNMLNTYNSSASDESKQAVANLMAVCGYAVRMNYGTSESGANSNYMTNAFVEYLGFSRKAIIEFRDAYKISDWNKLIYQELAEGRPVLYCGQSSSGGHAFVCDGYSSDGFFHINWGWGGLSDGYFLLSALNPSSLGVGGGKGGYNSDQLAAIKLMPDDGEQYINYQLYSENLSIDKNVLTQSDTKLQYLTETSDAIYNYSSGTYSGKIGLCFENMNTDNFYYPYWQKASLEIRHGTYHLSSHYANIKYYAPNGYYRVYPVMTMSDGSYKKIGFNVSNCTHLFATISDDKIEFIYPDVEPISVTNLTMSKQYINNLATCEFDISCDGFFKGDISAKFVTIDEDGDATNIADLESIIAEVNSETSHFTMQYTVPDIDYDSDTTYYLAITCDDDETEIDAITPITIEKGGSIAVDDFSLNYEGDSKICYMDDINVNVTIKADGGPINDYMTFYITNYNGNIFTYFNSDIVSLDANESADFVISGSFLHGDAGSTYYLVAGKDYNVLIQKRYSFTLTERPLASYIELNRAYAEDRVGEVFTLFATITPEAAANQSLTWESSNPDIATVTQEGVVTIVASGSCIISATTTDGSNLTASCIISIQTGTEEISSEQDVRFDIYTLSGILINSNASLEETKQLPVGGYILRHNGKSTKIIVK